MGVQEKPGRATRLFGAAEVIREAVGAGPLPPYLQSMYDRNVAEVCAELDEETLAAAWAEGRKMSIEEAIDCALGH